MSSYDHEQNFLTFGVGLVVASVLALLFGAVSPLDVGAAIFAAYVVLRIVNNMSQAERATDRERKP